MGLPTLLTRIGEKLSFKVGDDQPAERRITITHSKGRTHRTLPVYPEWAETLETWLKVQAKVMTGVPKEQDEGWLFLSETGSRLSERYILKALKRYLEFAHLSDQITLHSLRRYSLNKLAKANLLAAQAIAGHKDTKTTLLYCRVDPDFVRDVHAQVGVARGIVTNPRYEKEKKRRLG